MFTLPKLADKIPRIYKYSFICKFFKLTVLLNVLKTVRLYCTLKNTNKEVSLGEHKILFKSSYYFREELFYH